MKIIASDPAHPDHIDFSGPLRHPQIVDASNGM